VNHELRIVDNTAQANRRLRSLGQPHRTDSAKNLRPPCRVDCWSGFPVTRDPHPGIVPRLVRGWPGASRSWRGDTIRTAGRL